MAELEDTARYAIKGDPEGTLRWLFAGLETGLAFRRFLDTNLITYPGEPKRHCDTVARVVAKEGGEPPWAVVMEVEARARRNILARLLEYLARVLRKVRDGLETGEEYQVCGAVVLLTGRLKRRSLGMTLPGTPHRLEFGPRIICLEEEQAEGTLERIERGELSRGVLPWIPLMAGGGEAGLAQRWRTAASVEPSEERRGEWAGLAKVFADRVGCLDVWQKELEGWGMWKSKVIQDWRNDGSKETLLRVLRGRFPGQVTDEIAQRIKEEMAEDKIQEWADLAATAASIEDVRARVMP